MRKDRASKSTLSAGVAHDTSSPRIFNMAVQQTQNKCVRSMHVCGLWGSEGLGLRLAALMTQHNRHLPFRRLQKLPLSTTFRKIAQLFFSYPIGHGFGHRFRVLGSVLRRRLLRLTMQSCSAPVPCLGLS